MRTSATPPPAAPAPETAPVRVLYMEDDAGLARLVQRRLAQAGYAADVAPDGDAGLRKHLAQPYDILILDQTMPAFSGLDVIRELTRLNRLPPAIMLTGGGDEKIAIEAMKLGARDYILKDVDGHFLELLPEVVKQVASHQQLLQAKLQAEEELKEAYRRQENIAAEIQRTLLMAGAPQDIPGADLASLSLPSRAVGGDFVDFFRTRRDLLDIAVGDVMGKGIPAALLGAALKSQLARAMAPDGADPELPLSPCEILARLHAHMVPQLMKLENFATFCFARFDLRQREMHLVDCGHTQTIHYRARTRTCHLLAGQNLPLGFTRAAEYTEEVLRFEEGDIFVFYSDGITEASNPEGDFFGLPRLESAIIRAADAGAAALVDAIQRSTALFCGSEHYPDDFTCVAIKFRVESTEPPLALRELTVASRLDEIDRIRGFVQSLAEGLAGRIPDDGISALELAAVEAATNIIQHAYQGATDRELDLRADLFPNRVVVRLIHRGKPYAGQRVRPAFDGSRDHGFGLYFMERTTDRTEYVTLPDGRAATVLTKYFPPPPDNPPDGP